MLLILVSALTAVGCAASRHDAQRAENAARQAATDARLREDETLWALTLRAGTLDAYDEYLFRFPGGAHAAEARATRLRLAEEQPKIAITQPRTEPARPTAPPTGRVQEGGFVRLPVLIPAGPPFRLDAQSVRLRLRGGVVVDAYGFVVGDPLSAGHPVEDAFVSVTPVTVRYNMGIPQIISGAVRATRRVPLPIGSPRGLLLRSGSGGVELDAQEAVALPGSVLETRPSSIPTWTPLSRDGGYYRVEVVFLATADEAESILVSGRPPARVPR